jgi:hypothetical protein
VSEFESIGEDGELDPLDGSLADSIDPRFDAGKIAAELTGPQRNAAKMATALSPQLDFAKLIGPQLNLPKLIAPQIDIAKLIGPQLNAAKIATALSPQLDFAKLIGPQLNLPKLIAPQIDIAKLIGPQLNAAKIATALSPQLDFAKLIGPQLDIAKIATALSPQLDFAKLIGPQLDIAKIATALIGLTELEQLLTYSSVLPRDDHAVTTFDREQIRQLWGQYIYVQVLILCALLLLFFTMKLGTAENGLLTVFTGTTGVSGITVASKARKIAVDNFDKVFPPGCDVSAIINLML